ncbi:peptidyl-prolyl cis-trans isomerase A (cyclophilin A) [Sphingobium boeckii]|uniref:peptidylprolyl isomerase n=2 Tax=Sphingobium boeckii TaxID=1082345 RepID=A0A7W9AJY3_9SPHN|nr:peptidyl-prolyl cis-trans isomerase A (cyclophilin A) [Sphingobium boeckii]
MAQTDAPQGVPAAETPRPVTVKVTLTTSQGAIVVEVEKERAPITAANFLRYVDQKRLDGVTFYRVINQGGDFGLVQGGVSNDPKRVLKAIAHEPTSKTGLSHVDGAISMARGAPGSASGDFFITVGRIESFDAHPENPGDNLGYAVFGRVVEGMDVIRKILIEPTSPTAGAAAGMQGQMLVTPVKILTARRAN